MKNLNLQELTIQEQVNTEGGLVLELLGGIFAGVYLAGEVSYQAGKAYKNSRK